MALAVLENWAHLIGEPEVDDERYIEQRKRALEHAPKFRAALKKSRSVHSSYAHLIDSTIKQEIIDTTFDSDSDEEDDENENDQVRAFTPEMQDGSLSFKEGLQAELDRPYDAYELAEKLEAANKRKAVLRHRETRFRTVTVATQNEGMSYLDHHPDLVKTLLATSIEEEQLRLLRGFFFWLQHACNSDAFKPWVTPSSGMSSDDCFVVDIDG